MNSYSKILKKTLVAMLAVSMVTNNNVANAAAEIGMQKQQDVIQKAAEEEALKELIRDSDEMEAAYPNGLFNFLATQYSVKETDKYVEIGVIRQGGTQGEASVRFKAIDVTSAYGDDYTIYESKKKNAPIEKGEDAFPLIEVAYPTDTNLSEVSAEEVVKDALAVTEQE